MQCLLFQGDEILGKTDGLVRRRLCTKSREHRSYALVIHSNIIPGLVTVPGLVIVLNPSLSQNCEYSLSIRLSVTGATLLRVQSRGTVTRGFTWRESKRQKWNVNDKHIAVSVGAKQ